MCYPKNNYTPNFLSIKGVYLYREDTDYTPNYQENDTYSC
jgi:hypothetical protein